MEYKNARSDKMGYCEKCGKPMSGDGTVCAECVEINAKAALETIPEAASGMGAEHGKEKKSGKLEKIKRLIVNNGKESVVNFLIRKVFFCLLSAILSAAIVFFTQSSFKEDFEDYYEKTFVPLSKEINELAFEIDHMDDFLETALILDGMDETGESQLAEEMLNASTVMEKATEIYKKAVSYSSSDKEITKLHNCIVEVCEELQNVTAIVYTSLQMKEDYSVEYYAALQTLNSKTKVFKEMRNELCEKYGIEIENGEIK